MRKITFTVTNDLVYDQRMHRICQTLVAAGYSVHLIGRILPSSIPLEPAPFSQHRIRCFFNKGLLFYAEYNFRLFFYLLKKNADCCCAIDLDTILPNLIVSVVRKSKRVYDAHELFTQQKEIVTRPLIRFFWKTIERLTVPAFKFGYTVNGFIQQEFKQAYGVNYAVVRNLPHYYALTSDFAREAFIIYQGAVNEGRSFETLIPAMKEVNSTLEVYGNGNFYNKACQLVKHYQVEDKVSMKGWVTPLELRNITPKATIAVMLFENTGLNQYQSLANRFFDYIMAGVPQVCVDYPEYRYLNERYNVACLIADTHIDTIATALNNLLTDDVYYHELQQNCLKAREELNWEKEKHILLAFYTRLFSNEIHQEQ